jgi:hypothetical protein
MRRFLKEIAPSPDTRILDVGGCAATWDYVAGVSGQITILNVRAPSSVELSDARYTFVEGDGTALPFADNSFDLVFSNSVIEHVGSSERQRAFAREVARVGKALWIQTPAKSFPIEPHFIAPCLHWLPVQCRKLFARRFSLWGWLTKPTQERVNEFVDEIRLVTYREVRELFPHCEIIVERFLGLPKSYIAFRRGEKPYNERKRALASCGRGML